MARRKKGIIDTGVFGWKPRFLTDGVYVATAALVVCLFAGAGILDRYMKEIGSPYVAAVIVATLVDLANADRIDDGLGGLLVNQKLATAAQAKANDMAEKGYFAHRTPDGHDSWHWFEQMGYDYAYAGENLAVNFSESSDVQEAWMASPTHRANIVNEHYTEVGIAVAYGEYKGRPAIFAVQMFGKPSAKELRSRDENAGAAGTPVASPPQIPAVGAPGATLGEMTEGAVSGPPAASTISVDEIPWWASLVAEPQKTLRYAYYVIGFLVLAALFFDVQLELKWHHIRHAKKAGAVLVTMSMLFVVADWLFFGEPVLAAISSLM